MERFRGDGRHRGVAGQTFPVARLAHHDVHRVRIDERRHVDRRPSLPTERRFAPHHADRRLAERTLELANKLLLRAKTRLLHAERIVRADATRFRYHAPVFLLCRLRKVRVRYRELAIMEAAGVYADNPLRKPLRPQRRHKIAYCLLHPIPHDAGRGGRPLAGISVKLLLRGSHISQDAAAAQPHDGFALCVDPRLGGMALLYEVARRKRVYAQEEERGRREAHRVPDLRNHA